MDATHVDLNPLVQALIGLAATVVTVGGGLVAKRVFSWMGLKLSDQNMQLIDSVLSRSITAGAVDLHSMIAHKGWDHVDVHNAIIGSAMTYAVDKFPGVLAKAGLDPSDPATADRLAVMMRRALPAALAVVAASPATPPVK